ncbi:MAG: hypothetical protein GX316_00635 [Firmicutes bacterium]|nr:hypothetical protein [Bacillota bacterium]
MGKTKAGQNLWFVSCTTVFIMLFMICFSLPVKAEQQANMDVPLGHWSYEAVELLSQTPLISKGDVLFDGSTSISRYEMALLVAKILRQLDDLGSGNGIGLYAGSEAEILEELFASVKSSQIGRGALTDDHLKLIKRLVDGFNDELTSLGLIKQASTPMDLNLLFDPSYLRLDRVDQVSPKKDNDEEDDPFRLSGWRSVITSDSTVWRTGNLELEAGVSKILGEAYDPFAPEESRSVTTLEGRLQVLPGVKVSGGFSANPETETEKDAGAVRLGAQMTMGDVAVDASYKSISSQFDPLIATGSEGKKTSGYDVLVHYKDVTLSTGRETQRSFVESEKDGEETITSVGLHYWVGEEVALRADYRYVDIDQLVEIGEEPASTRRTTVGLGVNAPRASISLGLTYEQDQAGGRVSPTGASADIAHAAPWDVESVFQAGVAREDLVDADGKRKATSWSLGYNFRKEAALVFGYKMIDFTDTEGSLTDPENIATAELSIRF